MKHFWIWLALGALVAVAIPVQAGQSILKALAPAGGDGTRVILVIDWPQVKAHAANAELVMLRRRPAGMPSVADTLALLPADSSRYEDSGLDPNQAYHYFAYFKTKDSTTTEFGSIPAVVHLGPIHTRPDR